MGQESETAASTDDPKPSPTQTMLVAPASVTETLEATPQELSDLFQAPQAPNAPRAARSSSSPTATLRRASPTPGLGAASPVVRPLDTHVGGARPSVPTSIPTPAAPLAGTETLDGLEFAPPAPREDPSATRDVAPASRIERDDASTTQTVFRGSSSSLSQSADDRETPAALRGSERPESPAGVDRNLALARLQERMLGVAPEAVKIGRFIVIRKLGQGAMGIVYLAYDPKLDRKVALKLVDTSSLGSEMGEGQVRLEREARAAATLGHPNVVTVYDVGHQGDDVFLAMEYVEGETLTQWMTREHDWRETVTLFAEVARGLAAAHDAGLVHRDLKPDNVLLGEDGRPRVADFGLARPTEGWSARDAAKVLAEDSSAQSRARALRSSDALASTGEVCGTPAYMAPEQFVGIEVTPAADQFGFCASLYEALFGSRPFMGDSVTELAVAVIENDRQPLPSRHGVPKSVIEVVLAGLGPEPTKRHASMHVVADRLEAALRARTRMRVLAAGAVVAVLGIGFGAQAATALDEEPCDAAATEIESVWDPARRRSVEASLTSAGLPTDAAQELDDYAAQWTQQRQQSCEATRVSGEQSDDVLQLRTACLDRFRARIAAASEALETEASAQTLGLLDAALPSLDECRDVPMLTQQVAAYADDPGAKLEALAAWTETSTLMANLDLVHHRPPSEWSPVARQLLSIAEQHRELTHPMAYAHFWLGVADFRNGAMEPARAHLEAALPFAANAMDHRLLPSTLLQIAEVQRSTEQLAEAATHVKLARAMIERVRAPSERRILRREADFIEAALAVRHEPAKVAALLRPWLDADDTPAGDRVSMLSTFASACRELGDNACAVKAHGQALELSEGLADIEPIELAGRYANVGLMHADLGDAPQAVEHLTRAADIIENAFDAQHPMLGGLLSDIGGIEGHLLDPKDGERDLLAGLAVHEHNHGKDSPELVEALIDLNKTQLRLGKFEDAKRHGQWALRIVDGAFEGQHPRRADPRMPLADAYAATGQFDEAAAVLREGLEILDTPKTHPMQRAEFQFALARALAPTDADAAREMSESAVAGIADFEPGKPLRDAIEGWRGEVLDAEAAELPTAQP